MSLCHQVHRWIMLLLIPPLHPSLKSCLHKMGSYSFPRAHSSLCTESFNNSHAWKKNRVTYSSSHFQPGMQKKVFVLYMARHSHLLMESNAHFSPIPSSKAAYVVFYVLNWEIIATQEITLKNRVSEEKLSQTLIYRSLSEYYCTL